MSFFTKRSPTNAPAPFSALELGALGVGIWLLRLKRRRAIDTDAPPASEGSTRIHLPY
jgi:hypothetical protein